VTACCATLWSKIDRPDAVLGGHGIVRHIGKEVRSRRR